jgi:Holliday junction resolvase
MGLKATQREILPTRIETAAAPGVPDVMLCDEQGRIHLIELKCTAANAVRLSPHQVSFLIRHEHASVWIAVKRDGAKGKTLFLFDGSDAIAVAERGIAGAEGAEFRYPVIWNDVFELIAPLE